MDVGRRREPGGHPVVDDAQQVLAVVAADLLDRQGVQEPERLPLVGGQDEAAGRDTMAGFLRLPLWAGHAVALCGRRRGRRGPGAAITRWRCRRRACPAWA